MASLDKSHYYVDFSDRENLTTDEKNALAKILQDFLPAERAIHLIEYKVDGKITEDDYETATGFPYNGVT